jgi:ATP-dependent DNA helicase 2 subunit 1
VNAPKVQELSELLDGEYYKQIQRIIANSRAEAAKDPKALRNIFAPKKGERVPMGDVFTSCNWMLRDGFVNSTFSS